MSLQTRLEALISAIGADVKKMVRTDTDQDVFGLKKFLGGGGKPQIIFGPGGAVVGLGTNTIFMHNATTSDNGVSFQAIVAGGATALQMTDNGGFSVYTAPSVAAGATLTFTVRLGTNMAGSVTGPTAITSTGQIQGATFKANGNTGAATLTRWAGATASGAPTTGTFALNDFIIALDTMRLWRCTVAGTPGTWVEQIPPTIIDGGVP